MPAGAGAVKAGLAPPPAVPRRLTVRSARAYRRPLAGPTGKGRELSMTSAEPPASTRPIEAARNKLVEAVSRLERALEDRPRQTDPDALRAANAAVAARLDHSIERLKSVLEA